MAEERDHNVFYWLDDIRDKPSMYLRDRSLTELEALIAGYVSALWVHGIVETVPSMGSHFLHWLAYRTKWACDCGWAVAINRRFPDRDRAFVEFFKWVDKYRQLRPTTLFTVRLTARHKPTGKRVRYGLDGRMARPNRVDVVRYRPDPFHFLRFHYRNRIENDGLLMTGTGDYATTARYAKQWVRDELQVEFAEWNRVAKSGHPTPPAR